MLNYDNAENRRMTEHCIRTGKVLLNPIIDWDDNDVWEFLNMNGIEHCCLYDEGFKRIGCIGCPMGNAKGIKREFERWKAYKRMYLMAFDRMLKARNKVGLETTWKTADEVMEWWLGETE